MKPIKITEANEDKILDAIDAAEGKAQYRLAFWQDVLHAVEAAEANPVLRLLTKKEQVGATAVYSADCRVPRSYRYPVSYTALHIVRRASGWFLTDVTRELAYVPGMGAHANVTVTPDHLDMARDKLARTVSVDYGIEVAA